MATPTASEQTRIHENRGFAHGPVAILWDIENCPIPSDVKSEDVAKNIRTTLQLHHTIAGAVTMFSAYGDFHAFPKRLREGCQRTGIKLVDVPNGRKDAADKAILVDMFLFALDNPPPSSIVLISGDVDFAQALHILGQRRYTVVLVIPSRVNVSSALINSGQFVLDWPDIARTGQIDDESTITKSLSTHNEDQTDPIPWVQPGDLEGLRDQFARMIEISGGSLPLAKVHMEYQKLYGKPLHVSDFGSLKLGNLIKKMSDPLIVEGEGNKKFVRLLAGKRVISEENFDLNFRNFKYELEEILVSYSCRVFMGCFEEIYKQRYKKELDYRNFGVERLEELVEMAADVVEVVEEEVAGGGKRRFMVAVGSGG